MDWFPGKFTGTPIIQWENWWFPVDFPWFTNPLMIVSNSTTHGWNIQLPDSPCFFPWLKPQSCDLRNDHNLGMKSKMDMSHHAGHLVTMSLSNVPCFIYFHLPSKMPLKSLYSSQRISIFGWNQRSGHPHHCWWTATKSHGIPWISTKSREVPSKIPIFFEWLDQTCFRSIQSMFPLDSMKFQQTTTKSHKKHHSLPLKPLKIPISPMNIALHSMKIH